MCLFIEASQYTASGDENKGEIGEQMQETTGGETSDTCCRILSRLVSATDHDVPGLEVVAPHDRHDLLLRYRELRQAADRVLQVVGL